MSGRSRRRVILAVLLVGVLAAEVRSGGGGIPGSVVRAATADVRIFRGAPATFDPVAQSDIGTAQFTAQLFESLTAFDADLALRPALAASWDLSDDGRRVVFHLRPGLRFSDGTPITARDVVESWLRIIDPAQPSGLSALMLGVQGAADHLAGRSTDPAAVGLAAVGDDVVVDLTGPGGDFPAIVASPTFGVVPAAVWRDGRTIEVGGFVGSGAYILSAVSADEVTLAGNPDYWAGPPAIGTVHLLTTIGGRSPVAAFEAGDVDVIDIAASDAAWIRYDPTLGPQLRAVPSLSLTYLGFDTSRPPFDDVRVRRAFGAAVDWRRILPLVISGGQAPADSMVPPGIAGVADHDWWPVHDPAGARQLLAEAGYPGGAGFPAVDLAQCCGPGAGAIAADLQAELGVTVRVVSVVGHFQRLETDPPPMWMLGWVADYPGANDFLGVLLGTGSSSDYGRWSSPAFDAAIADALATRDPTVAATAYERALALVRDDVPVVPLTSSNSWALTSTALLGAGENGLGILRLAGLAWSPG